MQKTILTTAIYLLAAGVFAAASATPAPPPDFTKEKTFYVVPYAHLDTQWRWDYPETINVYLKKTLMENFPLLEKYPDYIYNLAGSWRYELMKEYYPGQWDKLKHYVAAGKWHPAGAMVEETDANVPSPESMIRNVLYGNQWLKREFGMENNDYLLPDCFGFQAAMPSVLAHCGIKGFSTQKLSWGSPIGIPFNVGVWEGPDGKSVIAALNGTAYTGKISADFANEKKYVERMKANGKRCGLFVDYRYFGVGDRAGACREKDLQNLAASLKTPGAFKIVPATSQRMYNDITPEQASLLPVYKGDLLLTEHSAGSLTSQAFMKRCNRKGEQLAQAAEAAGVTADWLGAAPYRAAAFRADWGRLIASQFHDNLPGTSLPECYDYCYNDDFIALKGFAASLTDGVSGLAAAAKTDWCQGTPVVVYNPLPVDREDPVEVAVAGNFACPVVFDVAGKQVPCQRMSGGKLLLLARVPSVGITVLDLRDEAKIVPLADSALKVADAALENGRYKVAVNGDGDIASVFDKQLNRELLSAPAQIQFLYENPQKYPAWNMDWADRQKPPEEVLKGPATIRIVENGPVRVAIEVERTARHSRFVQSIRLAAGAAADRLEIATFVDWRGKGCSVKQAFPLTASNPLATYNLGLGTIQRGNNNPGRYEVPSREWFDLTDKSGAFGVSVLEECKFGSDKPADNLLRLTLLHTPHVRKQYKDQQWQDWGRHESVYALYGHPGDGRAGESEWQARRLNQPLRAFIATRHDGMLASRSFLTLSSRQLDLRAMKKSEDGKAIIVRLQELAGKESGPVTLSFGNGIRDAWEVDGQERRIAGATLAGGTLSIENFTHYACRAFAIVPEKPAVAVAPAASQALDLSSSFKVDVISRDSNRTDGSFVSGLSYPAEQLPGEIISGGIPFKLGSGMTDGQKNAVECRGQTLPLPPGAWNELDLLVAADKDGTTVINHTQQFIPAWNQPVGNWDQRLWSGKRGNEYKYEQVLTGLAAGFVKPGRIAWFATHHHSAKANEAYQFCYLFHLTIPVVAGTREITLPADSTLKIFALSAVRRPVPSLLPAAPLHDDPASYGPLHFDGSLTATPKPAR